MGFAYSRDGIGWRHWDDPKDLAEGEVYFPQLPTAGQLRTAFPGYAAAARQEQARTLGKQLVAIQAAGCQIVSTGTPAISGTYGIDTQSEINWLGLQGGIAAGAPWIGWLRDTSGVKHVMTQEQASEIFKALLGYIQALDKTYDAALAAAAFEIIAPPQPVTIA